MHRSVIFCLLILALGLVMGAPIARADDGPVLVVPFTEPGNEENNQLTAATNGLQKALSAKGVTVVLADPVNHLAAVNDASQLCMKSGAHAIVVASVRTEQSTKTIYAVVTSVTHYPTHAEVRLAELRCDGVIAWSTIATADRDYFFNNLNAAITETVERAINTAVDAYVARTPSSPVPAATTSSSANAPTDPSVGIVPFTQPGSADPSLDFATENLAKHLAKRGIVSIQTSSLDHLAVPKNAADLCARYHINRLYVGSIRTEQTIRIGGFPTHVDVLIDVLDCTGALVAANAAIGDHFTNGANPRAGVSAAIDDALGHWSDRFAVTSK